MPRRRSFDESGAQWAWDATSLDTAQACLRKYYYSIIRGLRSDQPSVHLIFGGAYAAALETFYKLRAEGMAIPEALNIIVRQALVQTFQYRPGDDGEAVPVGPVPMLDDRKSRISLVRSIVWYVDQFGVEDAESIRTHHLQSGAPAVEFSFQVEFSDDISWCGHLDRVVQYGEPFYWLDNKTTGSALTESYFDGFSLSNQFMGYTWAGKIALDIPLVGGIIDAAQVGAQFTRFERRPIVFSNGTLEDWRESALATIAAAREATVAQKFPMNLTACGNYGGCPYRRVCSKSPHVREAYIRADFIETAGWDPATPR